MKTLLPGTKFYNFSKKFRQVTALSWTFLGGHRGARNFTGGRSLPAPPPSWNHPWSRDVAIQFVRFQSGGLQHLGYPSTEGLPFADPWCEGVDRTSVSSILVSVNVMDINMCKVLCEMCYFCVWDFHTVWWQHNERVVGNSYANDLAFSYEVTRENLWKSVKYL